MKNLKRISALFLSAALLAGTIAGCGKKGKESKPESKASEVASADVASTVEASDTNTGTIDTSEEVEVIFYFVSDRPAKQDEIDAHYNKLLKEKMNTTIKANWLGWAEVNNKYPLLFSSGEKFDLAYGATWLNYASLAQKGAFKKLDDLWPTYAPNSFTRQDKISLQQAQVNGSLYGIPTLFQTYSAYGPTYRTDILKDTDWDGKMENFDDYEVYLEYVKQNAPELEPVDIYQAGSELDDAYMYYQKLYGIKGSTNDFLWIDPFEENPQIFTYYEYEGTPDFLERMARWNEKGYFTKSALSDTDSTKLRNGKAASRVHNNDTYVGEYILHPERELKFSNFARDVSYMPATQNLAVVPNSAENAERALAVYDLLISDEELFRAYYYGIENTSYEIIDNQVKMLDTDNYAQNGFWTVRTNEFYGYEELGEVLA